MNIFSFIGWSGSGKTTVINGLIRELTGRGWTVMAAKKAPEKFDLEPAGKDSVKFMESGASVVYLAGKNRLMKTVGISEYSDFFKLAADDFKAYDFVLLEGFHSENAYLFEVADPSISGSLKGAEENLTAVICDCENFPGLVRFGRSDFPGITDLLESLKKSPRRKDEKLS